MRKFIDLIEQMPPDEFDYGDDFDADGDLDGVPQNQKPVKPYQFLNSLDQYKAKKHDARKDDREKWRQQQQKRYRNDMDDDPEFMSRRDIQKSLVEYKPFKFPLIRFGKFGKASRNYLPAEMRQEMGNVTHEAGVSCYMGSPYKDGYEFYLPHPDRAAYDVASWQYNPTENELKSLWKYLQDGTPMDIFLIHGHLKSFGNGNSWLHLGADGEYLLDTSKPHKKETLLPTQVYHGRMNLVDYIFTKFRNGRQGLEDYIKSQEEWDSED